jgi:hypothetical protein
MYYVRYNVYGKGANTREFVTYESAKRFFYFLLKQKWSSSAELTATGCSQRLMP